MKLETLKQFCSLHATPGDEGEVFNALLQRWKAQGLDTKTLGNYAVVAEPGERKKTDTVLLLAHADSPGFIVQSIDSPTELRVLALGGVHPTHDTPLVLKTAEGQIPALMHAPGPKEKTTRWAKLTRKVKQLLRLPSKTTAWTRTMPIKVTLETPCPSVQKGDRLCWAFKWEQTETEVASPFLDNRIGCALIADWYDEHADLFADMNVVLAASAMEEVNGYGANVLATHVKADAVLVLDITYTDKAQAIELGKGPVITLCDASVLLSPTVRDRLLSVKVPLQTEVYNYSGTDARAFPAQGIPTPAIPVLIPTEGNHSPRETLHPADLQAWPVALDAVAHALLSRN
jgi:endoglucanase